jgi:hypothetical protein
MRYIIAGIASDEWLIRTRKPLSPSTAPLKGWTRTPRCIFHYVKGIVEQDGKKYADQNDEENTIHKSYLQTNVRQIQRTFDQPKMYSLRLAKQNVNVQLHDNLN